MLTVDELEACWIMGWESAGTLQEGSGDGLMEDRVQLVAGRGVRSEIRGFQAAMSKSAKSFQSFQSFHVVK